MGLGQDVKADPIVAETMRNLVRRRPHGRGVQGFHPRRPHPDRKDPDYTYATARLLLHTIVREVLGRDVTQDQMAQAYTEYFPSIHPEGC